MSNQEDPVLRSSRREAVITGLAFVAAVSWTIGYCSLHAYGRSMSDPDFRFIWGIPDWVFWGIVAPWSACILFSMYFGSRFMKDEELGEEPPSEEGF